MSQFVTFVDIDGVSHRLNPEDVTDIFADPNIPAQTILLLTNGSQLRSSQAVATVQAALTVNDTNTVLQGTSPWIVSGTVSVNEPVSVDDNGGSLTVDAINLDIRDLSFTTDSVTAVQVLPYVVVFQPGTLNNGAQTAVAAAAIQVLAANVNRKACLIQNVGLANVRVGVSGVTTTTGFRLVPGQIVILEMPHVPTQAIFAIREGAVSSTVLAQEIV